MLGKAADFEKHELCAPRRHLTDALPLPSKQKNQVLNREVALVTFGLQIGRRYYKLEAG